MGASPQLRSRKRSYRGGAEYEVMNWIGVTALVIVMAAVVPLFVSLLQGIAGNFSGLLVDWIARLQPPP